jgi:hypothetical protein
MQLHARYHRSMLTMPFKGRDLLCRCFEGQTSSDSRKVILARGVLDVVRYLK